MAFKPYQLKSGVWRGGFLHPITRKKVTATRDEHGRTFDYAYEAEAWAQAAEQRARDLAAGKASSPSTSPSGTDPVVVVEPEIWEGPTVLAYGRDYIERRAGMLARSTRDNYAAHLDGLARPVSGRLPIGLAKMGTLKRSEVERWITDSVNAGVGVVSINYRLGFLRTLYRDMLAAGEAPIQRDPTIGLKRLPVDQNTDRVLTEQEEARLLEAADPLLRVASLVALDAGLRWQEVYALRPAAMVGDFITVTHVVERGSNELRAHPKGRKRRIVPVTDRLGEALAPLLEQADGPEALLFPATGDPDRVRRSHRADLIAGRLPWDYNNHRKRLWLPLLGEIGLARRVEVPTSRVRKYGPDAGEPVMQLRWTEPEIGFHGLRHTYGSRLAAAGVPRSEIAKLLGHAQESTTERYIHAGDDGRRLDLVRAALGHAA